MHCHKHNYELHRIYKDESKLLTSVREQKGVRKGWRNVKKSLSIYKQNSEILALHVTPHPKAQIAWIWNN